jgi:hypothetical protein
MEVCNSHGGRSPQARHAAAVRLAELSARREVERRLAAQKREHDRELIRLRKAMERIIESIGR